MRRFPCDLKRMTPILVASLFGAIATSAHADVACDAEIAALQAELDAPEASVNAADLASARQLFEILETDCGYGTAFEAVAPISQEIRALLGMGAA